MKRILFFSFVFLVASVSSVAFAGKKKDKKKTADVQPVQLVTPSDSTSYAAGYAASDGVLPYLTGRMHIDTAYISEFERGYREAINKVDDKAYQAYLAGCNFASMAAERMLPGMSRELVGTDDSISAAPFHEGFIAGINQDTTVFKMNEARERFQKRSSEARETRNRILKKENETWLENNKTKPGVVTLPSGLQYKVLTEGNGPKPQATDTVEVIYEGKTINGKVFDATANHGGRKTDEFRCDRVVKGWTEALTNMNVGSKWEIYIPYNLGYGAAGYQNIKPYATLIFTLDLVGIKNNKATENK